MLAAWDWREAVRSLNDNGTAVQALLALVLVVVTSWYAWLTRRAVRAAEQSRRPYVYLDFEFEGPRLANVVIGNAGDRGAESITFEIEQDIYLGEGKTLSSEVPPLSEGLQYLAPQRRYFYMFLSPFDFDKEKVEAKFKANVSYRFGQQKYNETIRFNFSAFENVLFRSFREPGAEIAQAVSGLRRAYEQARPSLSPILVSRTACPKCREMVRVGARRCPHCLGRIGLPVVSRVNLRPLLDRVTARIRRSAEGQSGAKGARAKER